MKTLECIGRTKKRRGIDSYKYKVSICIPAYKQPDHLRKALKSIITQSFKNYEVIITDDSPDDSVTNVVKEFRQYPNLKYYKNSVTKGSPENWNEAIRCATGEYIKILHHDDWFPNSDCLSAFVKMLDEHPEADFAFSGSFNYNIQGLKFTHKAKPKQIHNLQKDPMFIFCGNFIGAPSATIYRRNLDILFDPKLKWVVDIDFYIRALYLNKNFNFTYEPIVAITVDSEHQVSASCVNNKAIDLFENLYLYNKISNNSTVVYNRFKYIWNLLERYEVKSQQDIIDCGYHDPLGPEINLILKFQKIYRLILIAINYVKKLLSLQVWSRFVLRGISFAVAIISKKVNRKS